MHVLIVEDSPTQALLLQTSLEQNRLTTTLAKDGLEALEKIEATATDIIISDIEMPRMNGYEFCKAIKAKPQYNQIPVILLTGLTDPMDVVSGIECGADSFLTKPCEINFLLSTMNDLLENRKIRKNLPPGESLVFSFNGKHLTLNIDKIQVTDLLLSTYLNAIQKNSELERAYTYLKAVNDELKDKNGQLKKLNELKNQFLGMAAHDLRNPLGVIGGSSELLASKLSGQIDEKSLRWLENIKNTSNFMLQLINDLLDISVIESGKVDLHLSEVSLVELIQDNLVFLKSLAEKKQIEIIFDYDKDLPKIKCDPSKVAQIVNNLVTNSIKFSNPNNKIEIGLKKQDGSQLLTVKDHGTGIPLQYQENIFKPFAKGRASGTAGEKTTGLGLAIVNNIVNEHKGKIWFESKEGEGTTFYVSLLQNAYESAVK